ncbi:MAG: Yip1 family protein [Ginsengibacter sp.]
MNLIERVKNILLTPKTEWLVIDTETASPQSMLMSYVLPLAIISALGRLLGGMMPGTFMGSYLVWMSIIGFISIFIGFYISTYVIDLLAPSFESEKNLGKSAQLVAYSNTPVWVAGFLSFIPIIGWLLAIAGWVYSIYLFYNGLGVLKKTPEDKKVVYMVVAFIVMIAITFMITAILTGVLGGILGFGMMSRGMFGM